MQAAQACYIATSKRRTGWCRMVACPLLNISEWRNNVLIGMCIQTLKLPLLSLVLIAWKFDWPSSDHSSNRKRPARMLIGRSDRAETRVLTSPYELTAGSLFLRDYQPPDLKAQRLDSESVHLECTLPCIFTSTSIANRYACHISDSRLKVYRDVICASLVH